MGKPSNHTVHHDDPDSVNPQRRVEADQRDDRADAREAALHARENRADAREDRADARDAAQADREEHVRSILAGAGIRDGHADDRDAIADGRDATASLESFLHDDKFAGGLKARRFAALDRLDSRTDRASAASDRIELTEDTPTRHAEPENP